MAQSRRPSTTKHTSRQSADLPESLRNIQAIIAPMTTPAKPSRRPVAQRGENQPNKPHLKESPIKRDSQIIKLSEPEATVNNGTDNAAISDSKTTVNAVRHVEMERGGKRVVMTISFPNPPEREVSLDLKEIANLEPSHDLESTSKGLVPQCLPNLTVVASEPIEMLEVYGVNENIPPPMSEETSRPVAGREDSLSSDANYNKPAINGADETPHRGRTLQRSAVIVPRPYKSNNAASSESLVIKSAKPPDIIPKETAVPPATPKRQIRLATSNSSAAEWFATGPINDKKKEPKEPEIPIADLQTPPSDETQIQEPPTVPDTAIVYLLEPGHVEVESESCTTQSATDNLTGKCLLIFANCRRIRDSHRSASR
jgi:hypothetical protein